MVLPAPAPHDAPRPNEPSWLARLSGILRLVRGGVLVLVDQACPERLGELVRSLMPAHPELEVHTDAARLTRVTPGALVILVPDPEQATWLNTERPLFANRALRVILFSDAETSGVLARRAPDFFNWISHRLECPAGVSLPAVRGIRAALRHRAAGVAWHGGDFEGAFRAALPGRSLAEASASAAYEEMVAAAKPSGKSWVSWSDVDGPFRLRRVRWAAAEVGRRGRVVLIEPSLAAPGFAPVHGKLLGAAEAGRRLEAAGAKRPGRLAALLELEPEAVEAAVGLLRTGVDEAELETATQRAEDPGATAAQMAGARGIEVGAALRARTYKIEAAPAEHIEALIRKAQAGTARWVDVARESLEASDPRASVVWAKHELAAEPVDPEALWVAGGALQRAGSYAEAEGMLRAAVTRYEVSAQASAEAYATALREFGVLLDVRARYPEGGALLRRALDVARHSLGAKHPLVATCLRSLGGVHMSLGKYDEAEALYREAAAIRREVCGEDSPKYASMITSLGGFLETRGRHEEAESLVHAGLMIAERRCGIEHTNYAHSLGASGWLLVRKGLYDEAEGMLRRSSDIYEKVLGHSHPTVADAYECIAGALHWQGKFTDAEALLHQAIDIYKHTLGEEHPYYGLALSKLAGELLSQGKPHEATALLRTALAVIEKTVGPEHPWLVGILSVLGLALAAEGHIAEGELLASRAVQVSRGTQDTGRGFALSILAILQAARGDHTAPATSRDALEALHQVLGPDHSIYKQFVPFLEPISSPPQN